MKTLNLNDGKNLPQLGFGVYQIPANETKKAVLDALEVGYRLIDTASAYGNEKEVGEAIKESGIASEVFVTTKLWISDASEKKARVAYESSLEKLGKIDLYLIHQPYNDVYGAWRAMSELKRENAGLSIGVSNFNSARLADFSLYNEITPALNQIEINPFFTRASEREYMKKLGIVSQAWAPFAEGREGIFTNPVLSVVAAKHNRSVASVILRYLLDMDIAVVVKSVKKERMRENLNVFDFELDEADRLAIAGIERGESAFFNHEDVERIEWLKNLHL